jgi:tetratricopeptide (TPR) repeat protein
VRRALAIDPTDLYALINLGELGLVDGRPAEALAVFQKIEADDVTSEAFRLFGVAMAEHSLGHAQASQRTLDELIAKAAALSACQIAEVYAWRGEKGKAFEWLERAYRQRDGGLVSMKADPLFKSLRGDPRFNAMLRKINLSE